MISISAAVEEEINKFPYLREAMNEKIINLSALAKKLQPTVEDVTLRPASQGAIVAALQRLQAKMKPYYSVNPGQFLGDLSVSSGLSEIILTKSEATHKLVTETIAKNESASRLCLTSSGAGTIGLIAPIKVVEEIGRKAGADLIVAIIGDLSALTLKRKPGQVERTGVLYYPLQVLAWQDISSVEVMTTPADITIFLKDDDVSRAFVAVYEAVESVRAAN